MHLLGLYTLHKCLQNSNSINKSCKPKKTTLGIRGLGRRFQKHLRSLVKMVGKDLLRLSGTFSRGKGHSYPTLLLWRRCPSGADEVPGHAPFKHHQNTIANTNDVFKNIHIPDVVNMKPLDL